MELIDELTEYVQQLSEQHKMALRTGYNTTRGFHVQLYAGSGGKTGAADVNKDNLPAEFIKVTKLKSTLSFTTLQMVSYAQLYVHATMVSCSLYRHAYNVHVYQF